MLPRSPASVGYNLTSSYERSSGLCVPSLLNLGNISLGVAYFEEETLSVAFLTQAFFFQIHLYFHKLESLIEVVCPQGTFPSIQGQSTRFLSLFHTRILYLVLGVLECNVISFLDTRIL